MNLFTLYVFNTLISTFSQPLLFSGGLYLLRMGIEGVSTASKNSKRLVHLDDDSDDELQTVSISRVKSKRKNYKYDDDGDQSSPAKKKKCSPKKAKSSEERRPGVLVAPWIRPIKIKLIVCP